MTEHKYYHPPCFLNSAVLDGAALMVNQRNRALLGLSSKDMTSLTGGALFDRPSEWLYNSRYQAQRILDRVYLGPVSAARDRNFLQRENITMIISCRDTCHAAIHILSCEKMAAELDIQSYHFDVSDCMDMIHRLPDFVRVINDHLLAPPKVPGGPPNRVLVYCETGNERSALVIAGYIVTMFDADIQETLIYLSRRRLSSGINTKGKNMLASYADLLQARRDVLASLDSGNKMYAHANDKGVIPTTTTHKQKRRIEETWDAKSDDCRSEFPSELFHLSSMPMAMSDTPQSQPQLQLDMDRFRCRGQMAPFVVGPKR